MVREKPIQPLSTWRKWAARLLVASAGIIVAAVLLVIGTLSVFFYGGMFYRGDGTYRHPGNGATFEVDFGEVDVSTPFVKTFRFSHLGPSIPFHIVLRTPIGAPLDASTRSDRPNPYVRIKVVDAAGSVVASEEGWLQDWEWSVNRLSNRKRETSFEPKWSQAYALTFETVRGDTSAGHPLRLKLEAYTAGP
jgi:hypothetical protein